MEAKLDNNKLLSRGREDKRGVFPNRSPGVFIRIFFRARTLCSRQTHATVLELKRSLEQTRRKEKKKGVMFVVVVVVVCGNCCYCCCCCCCYCCCCLLAAAVAATVLPFIFFCVLFSLFRCTLRILDSFGTDPEFNYAGYNSHIPKELRSNWGNADVHPRQIMTMFRKTK